MINDKKIIQIGDTEEIICLDKILMIFIDSFKSKRDDWYKYKMFIKKGEDYKLKGLETMVYPLVSDENKKILKINYSDFAKNMLNEIDKYRIIDSDVYKICEKKFIGETINTEGDYILSIDWNPEFRISTSKVNRRYIFDSIKFQSFDKKEFLDYIPRNKEKPENQPNEIQLEVQLKNNSILHKSYKQILKHYSNK